MKGVIRSPAVHHQPIAFRARLYDAKNKAPEEEAGISTRQTLSLSEHNLVKKMEGWGGGRERSAISLVRWGSIGGREEWGKNKRVECKAP